MKKKRVRKKDVKNSSNRNYGDYVFCVVCCKPKCNEVFFELYIILKRKRIVLECTKRVIAKKMYKCEIRSTMINFRSA